MRGELLVVRGAPDPARTRPQVSPPPLSATRGTTPFPPSPRRGEGLGVRGPPPEERPKPPVATGGLTPLLAGMFNVEPRPKHEPGDLRSAAVARPGDRATTSRMLHVEPALEIILLLKPVPV